MASFCVHRCLSRSIRVSLLPLLFSSLSANPIRRDYKRIRRRISSDCEQREGRTEVRRAYRTESVCPTDRLPECRVPSGKLPDSSSDSDAVKPQTFSAPQTTDDRDRDAASVCLSLSPPPLLSSTLRTGRVTPGTTRALLLCRQEGSLLTPTISDFLSSMRKAVTQNITLRYQLL